MIISEPFATYVLQLIQLQTADGQVLSVTTASVADATEGDLLGDTGGGGSAGMATNSIFFCSLFVKNHRFAWRANQLPLFGKNISL